MNTAADLVEGSIFETLTYYSPFRIHWENPQIARADHERDLPKDPVVGNSFPDGRVMPQAGRFYQRGIFSGAKDRGHQLSFSLIAMGYY